jgi:uncharacterized protein
VKLLLWLAVGLLVVWLMRKKTLGAPNAFRPKPRRNEIESMIQCAHCGVHIPVSESVVDASGRAFCSEEHSRLHAKRV